MMIIIIIKWHRQLAKVGGPGSDEMSKGVALHMLLSQNVARLSERYYGFIHIIDCHNLHQPHKRLPKLLVL